MQALEQPEVYFYEVSAEPSVEALKRLMQEDGADLGGNVLGVMVKMPPSTLYGVKRYELVSFYGDAYGALTDTVYRNRDGLTWLMRGAQDDPALIESNLKTTIAELEAGREPFAWQTEPINQGSRVLVIAGAALVAVLVVALLARVLIGKGTKAKVRPQPFQPPKPPAERARDTLEQSFLEARYAHTLSQNLKAESELAKRTRDLIFGETADIQVYQSLEAELLRGMSRAPVERAPELSDEITPFDKDIAAAFEKIEGVLRAKYLDIERCHYHATQIDKAQGELETIQHRLKTALATVSGESAQGMLHDQLRRLDEVEAAHTERLALYQKIKEDLHRDIKTLTDSKAELLKKREVYTLVEASLKLQRDSSQQEYETTSPPSDIEDLLNNVADLIDAHMEVPMPTYGLPPLPSVEPFEDSS